jgi:ribose transport system substrate-binding protein
LEDGVLNITFIPKALDNPVFAVAQVGAERRAEELTEQGPCEVLVNTVAPLRTTAEDQAQLIRDVIEQGETDAIGVSCIDPVGCIEPINEAIEAGIPVITWDAASPDSDRLTYLALDNYEGGLAAAELLVNAMGEEGRVAVLSGVPGSANLEARIQGFLDGIEDYPDIEVVTTVYSDDLATKGVEEVERVMEESPDLDAWFFAGLWPFLAGQGAMPLWEQATLENGMVSVSFDNLPVLLDLVEDGYLAGLVGQKYWGHGYDTVQALYEYLLYDREFESFTNIGMYLITPLNVGAMQEMF